MLMSEERPYKCPHGGCHKDYKHERNLMEHIRGSHPKSRCAPKRCSGQGSSQSVSPPKRRCVKPSAPAPARSANLFHDVDLEQVGTYTKLGADGWWRQRVVRSNCSMNRNSWLFWHDTEKISTAVRSVRKAREKGIKTGHLFDGTNKSDKQRGLLRFFRRQSVEPTRMSDLNISVKTKSLPTAIQSSQQTINDVNNLIQQNNCTVEEAINVLEAHFKKKKGNELCIRLKEGAQLRHHNPKTADKLLKELKAEGKQKHHDSLLNRGRQLSSVADRRTDIETSNFTQLVQYVSKHDKMASMVKLQNFSNADVGALRLAVRTALQELADRKIWSCKILLMMQH